MKQKNKMINIHDIKILLSENEVLKALNVLLNDNDVISEFEKELILLKRRYIENKNLGLNSIASKEEVDMENNRITFSLVEIAQKIKLNQEKRSDKPQQSNIHFVSSLPKELVVRNDKIDAIKKNIFSGQNNIIGINGMAGVGKSVLACCLANDIEIQNYFNEGIVWLTFGNYPDIHARHEDSLIALNYISEVKSRDYQSGKNKLSEFIKNRKILFILDDIWKQEHIENFVNTYDAKIVFTTRDNSIVKNLGAEDFKINVLTKNQSLLLLSKIVRVLPDNLPSIAIEIIKECGYLPLTIAIIGGLIKKRQKSWEYVYELLKNRKLENLKRQFENYPYEDVYKAIDVSIQLLTSKQKQNFLNLGIFQEDAVIPKNILSNVWSIDRYEAETLADTYFELSLIENQSDGTIAIHDLIYDYIKITPHYLNECHKNLTLFFINTEKEILEKSTINYINRYFLYHFENSNFDAEFLIRKITDLEFLIKINQLLNDIEGLLKKILGIIPPQYFVDNLRLKNLSINTHQLSQCISYHYGSRLGSHDPHAKCKQCGENSIIHGYMDMGGLDYDDHYISWCSNCFWAYFERNWQMMGYEEPRQEFSYETNRYESVK